MHVDEYVLKKSFRKIKKENPILWVDFEVLFPYDFEESKITICLKSDGGKNILETCINATNRKDWYLSRIEDCAKYGVPFLFNSFAELNNVRQVICIMNFSYHNINGEKCEALVCAGESISFNERSNANDYVLKIKATSIPALLEKNYEFERKAIIDMYDEVILSNTISNNSVYTATIKSTSCMSSKMREFITNSILNGFKKKSANIYMHIFLKNDIEILQPELQQWEYSQHFLEA